MSPELSRLIARVRWARKSIAHELGPIRMVRISRGETPRRVTFYLRDVEVAAVVAV